MPIDTQNKQSIKQFSIRNAFFYYLLSCIFLLIVFAFIMHVSPYHVFELTMISYLVIGIFLTKRFLGKMIFFHDINDTISNNVSLKLKAIIFWPIFYLILFIKLGFLHIMK